jgi:hypothetical protein
MLGMGFRLCWAQGIGGRRCLRCVPLANYSSKFPRWDARGVTTLPLSPASSVGLSEILSDPGGELVDKVLEDLLAFATPAAAHVVNSHNVPFYLWDQVLKESFARQP